MRDLMALDAVVKAIEGTGLDRGDLAFKYDDQTDLWQIVQRDNGTVVLTDNPDETFFSTRQLITEASGLREDEARKRYDERRRKGAFYGVGFGAGF